MAASTLAQNDALTTGKLHPTTRKALDRIWTVQRKDGGFDWMKYNQPPSEIDDHYGVTMAAIGVGVAPDEYAETPAAKAGLDKIRAYFKNNPPTHLHHRAMKLLVSLHVDGIMTKPERQQVVEDLFALQKPDGGWGVVTMGNWERSDDKPPDMESSDGYGTGFAVYVLRRAGVAAEDPRIQKMRGVPAFCTTSLRMLERDFDWKIPIAVSFAPKYRTDRPPSSSWSLAPDDSPWRSPSSGGVFVNEGW